MICSSCAEEIKKAVDRDVITADQARALISGGILAAGAEAKKTFNPVMIIYYFGALLILSAFGWFMGNQWDALGPKGILVTSLLYAALFVFAGRVLAREEKFPIAGGLLFTCAVGMTPLIVWSLQKILGVWPATDPGGYHGYYVWINGSWIVIELATIAATFAALRQVKFPFLLMPAAIAFWFLSMDVAEIFIHSHRLNWEMRSWVSVVTGVLVLILAWLFGRRSRGVDYPFWLHLAGLLAFWGGLTSLPSHGELGRAIYALINIGLLVLSLRWGRKTYAFFGTLGIYGYLGHLAFRVFKDSPLFPVVLAFLGLFMILGAVLLQKNYGRLRLLMGSEPDGGINAERL